jgi:hypothetical protein
MKMKFDRSENLTRRYLLGELSEADQTAFEEELLIDRGKFDQARAIENELIDSYVRGDMSHARRERFESHYLASSLHRERVKIATALLTHIDQAAGEKAEAGEKGTAATWRRWHPLRASSPVFGATLAIALLLLISFVWSRVERIRSTGRIAKLQDEAQAESALLRRREQELTSQNREIEKELAEVNRRNEQMVAELERLRRQPPVSSPAVLSFLLSPPPVRGEQALPQATIPRLTGQARLLMELGNNDYANCQAILQTVEGREIFRRRTDKVRFGKDQVFAALPIEAGEIARGDYILILFGRTSEGKTEEIDQFFFRVL